MKHPGRARIASIAAIVAGVAYLGIRTTTLGHGWTLALSIPLIVAELWALTQLVLFTFAAWRIETHATGVPDVAPAPIDIVIDASLGDLPMLERTLVGAHTVDSRAAVRVVDTMMRPALQAMATDFGASYVVDEAPSSHADAVLAQATTDLYLWLEAGQVPMPNAITAISPRFQDPSVAVCQSAIGLLNADSLAHVQRGRDEDALQRDVLGPGLDRLDCAPWFGPGSVVRCEAIDSVGGFVGAGSATLARTLVRLQTDGWTSRFESKSLVRTVAPDTLGDYLGQRRRRMIAAWVAFRTPQNPLRTRGLSAKQRLAHLSMASMYGSGIRQLLVLAVLVATLITGRLPFVGPLVPLASSWAVATGLAAIARRQLARGSMSLGDWTRQGWRTLGSDLQALLAMRGFALRNSDRSHPAATGLRSLGRLRVLTVAVIALDVALLLRAATLVDADLLPAFSTGARIAVLTFGLMLLVPMVDVLQLVVTRRQRRKSFRLPVQADIELGDTTTHTVDLAISGVGVLMDAAPAVGALTPFALVLPMADGTPRRLSGTAIVRSANSDPSGFVRVGLEFTNLSPPVRRALVEYCLVGHAAEGAAVAGATGVAEPHVFPVTSARHHHHSLRTLTGIAGLAGLATLVVGPTLASASDERSAAGPACASEAARSTASGAEIQAASIEGTNGCHRVTLTTPDGQGAPGATVRYYADGWIDAGATDAGGAAYVNIVATDVEVVWERTRAVFPTTDDGVDIVLGRIDAGGARAVEIERGAGWEPFSDGMAVLPGRVVVRLADGHTVKAVVRSGHALDVSTGTQTALELPAQPDVGDDGDIQDETDRGGG